MWRRLIYAHHPTAADNDVSRIRDASISAAAVAEVADGNAVTGRPTNTAAASAATRPSVHAVGTKTDARIGKPGDGTSGIDVYIYGSRTHLSRIHASKGST